MTARWTPQELREWANDVVSFIDPSQFIDPSDGISIAAVLRAHADAMEACMREPESSTMVQRVAHQQRLEIIRILSGEQT